MVFASIIFFLALFGIVALFAVKYWEVRTERVFLLPWREKVDIRAQELKELLDAARIDLAKLPPEAVRLSRVGLHQFALGFAALARSAERHAHQVADLVSYKHRFEKRDTRSEFLKRVSEHKNGLPEQESGLDTTTDNGHNT